MEFLVYHVFINLSNSTITYRVCSLSHPLLPALGVEQGTQCKTLWSHGANIVVKREKDSKQVTLLYKPEFVKWG